MSQLMSRSPSAQHITSPTPLPTNKSKLLNVSPTLNSINSPDHTIDENIYFTGSQNLPIRNHMPHLFNRDDSSVDYMQIGGNSLESNLKHNLSIKPSLHFKTRNQSLNYDYSTQLGEHSLLSRHRRNQRTLDSIQIPELKMKYELQRIKRDISDNVLEHHRPGIKIDPLRNVVTMDKLKKIDDSFKNLGMKLGVIQKSDAIWNKISVSEQSDRIRELLKRKKLRINN